MTERNDERFPAQQQEPPGRTAGRCCDGRTMRAGRRAAAREKGDDP